MANVNIVVLAGNLTRDPEVRYTPSGMAISQLGVAINRKYKDTQSGEMREETTFVDVDVFGRQAETCGQYLSKGRQVMIEGRLKFDQWDDKQTGQRRSKLKVVAIRVQFLGSGPGAGGGGGGGQGQQRQAPQGGSPPPDDGGGDLDIPEDNIPF